MNETEVCCFTMHTRARIFVVKKEKKNHKKCTPNNYNVLSLCQPLETF